MMYVVKTSRWKHNKLDTNKLINCRLILIFLIFSLNNLADQNHNIAERLIKNYIVDLLMVTTHNM